MEVGREGKGLGHISDLFILPYPPQLLTWILLSHIKVLDCKQQELILYHLSKREFVGKVWGTHNLWEAEELVLRDPQGWPVGFRSWKRNTH